MRASVSLSLRPVEELKAAVGSDGSEGSCSASKGSRANRESRKTSIKRKKKGPDKREDDRNGEKQSQWKTELGNLHLLNTVSTKRGHVQETSAK